MAYWLDDADYDAAAAHPRVLGLSPDPELPVAHITRRLLRYVGSLSVAETIGSTEAGHAPSQSEVGELLKKRVAVQRRAADA